MGITVRSGTWDAQRIAAFLEAATIPIRLASSGRQGPMVQSLWFRFHDQALWCCTQRDSLLAKRLRRDDLVGFEVAGDAPPYRGVRGRGRAELVDDAAADLLPILLERYLGPDGPETSLGRWLIGRLDTETAIRIHSVTATSWDYSARMDAPN